LECAARSKRANIKIKVVNQDSLRIEDGPKEPTNQAFINVYSNGTKGNYIAVCENDVDKKVIWRWEIEFVGKRFIIRLLTSTERLACCLY